MRQEAHRQWLIMTGQTQTQVATRVPTESEKKLAMKKANETFSPMPQQAVYAMLGLLDLKPGQLVYDLGCGDGRILKTANQVYSCSVLGIEINPNTYKLAVENLQDCVGWRVINADATKYNLEEADVVTLYMYPDVMDKMRFSTLKPGASVISYNHDIPNLPTDKVTCELEGKTYTFYIHKKK